MKRYVLFLFVLLIAGVSRSQDTLTKREQTLKQALNMNAQDFKVYARNMREIQKKILRVQKDSTLSFEQKKDALQALHAEKEVYIKSHLSPEQQSRLNDYNESNARHSSAYSKHEQDMNKIKKKATKPGGS